MKDTHKHLLLWRSHVCTLPLLLLLLLLIVSCWAYAVIWSRGVFIYSWYALLFHLPNIFMVASLISHFAPVVATPIRKQWPK